MITNDLGKNVNLNNAYEIINSLCNDGYMYENDGIFYLN